MAIPTSDIVDAFIGLIALGACVRLWLSGWRSIARIVWIAAIISVCVPFFDFHSHTHWAKVAWIPFVSPPIKAPDLAANIVLYIPFGFLLARVADGARAMRYSVLAAAALSVAVEFSQLFSHSRFPSSTDVVCNVVGAIAGLTLRRAWEAMSVRVLSNRSVRDA